MTLPAWAMLLAFAAAALLAVCPEGRLGGAVRWLAVGAAAFLLAPPAWRPAAVAEAAWSPWAFLEVLPLRFRLDAGTAAWSALALGAAALLPESARVRRLAGWLAFAALGTILAERFDTALAFDVLALPAWFAALAAASPAAGLGIVLRFAAAEALLAFAAFGNVPPQWAPWAWAAAAALRLGLWPLQGWLTESQRQAPGGWIALPVLAGLALLAKAPASFPSWWALALPIAGCAAAALAHGVRDAGPRMAALLALAAAFALSVPPAVALLGVAALALALPEHPGPHARGDRWSALLGFAWLLGWAWSAFAESSGPVLPPWLAAAALLLAAPAWAASMGDDAPRPLAEAFRRAAFAGLASAAAWTAPQAVRALQGHPS